MSRDRRLLLKVAGNFAWDGPPFDGANGGRVHKSYDTLAGCQIAGSQDLHSLVVGLDVFVNVKPTDEADPRKPYELEKLDFRPRPRSAAIDKGTVLLTITDGFKGAAPDLGAYEFGSTPPHCRPQVWPVGDARPRCDPKRATALESGRSRRGHGAEAAPGEVPEPRACLLLSGLKTYSDTDKASDFVLALGSAAKQRII